uniref:CSON007841 protein n=2 Tax=Culicoides sonorensis TaxID=179676 RepID=A0A336LBW7_CULSO
MRLLSDRIFGATSYGVVHPLFSRRVFDVCIVDEATQMTQPLILRCLLNAKTFILVGDPHQLPPVIKSHQAKALGGDESLFCQLAKQNKHAELKIQYRMNQRINDLVNAFSYHGKLLWGCVRPSIYFDTSLIQYEWETRIFSSSLENSVIFLDTGNSYEKNIELHENKMFSEYIRSSKNDNIYSSKSYLNLVETALVVHIVSKLIRNKIDLQDIGVIATYRSQADCIKNIMKSCHQYRELEVNTVDQFQGRDKEVIIYSCTKTKRLNSSSDCKTKSNEILDDHRRVTVAITRAKNKLIIIGDSRSIVENAPFQLLFNSLSEEIIEISDKFYDVHWNQLLEELPINKKKAKNE